MLGTLFCSDDRVLNVTTIERVWEPSGTAQPIQNHSLAEYSNGMHEFAIHESTRLHLEHVSVQMFLLYISIVLITSAAGVEGGRGQSMIAGGKQMPTKGSSPRFLA